MNRVLTMITVGAATAWAVGGAVHGKIAGLALVGVAGRHHSSRQKSEDEEKRHTSGEALHLCLAGRRSCWVCAAREDRDRRVM